MSLMQTGFGHPPSDPPGGNEEDGENQDGSEGSLDSEAEGFYEDVDRLKAETGLPLTHPSDPSPIFWMAAVDVNCHVETKA